MANGHFGGGSGLLDDPYLIEDIYDLLALETFKYGYFKVINNIYLGEYIDTNGWTGITINYDLYTPETEQFDKVFYIDFNNNTVDFEGRTVRYGLFVKFQELYNNGHPAIISNLNIINIILSTESGPLGYTVEAMCNNITTQSKHIYNTAVGLAYEGIALTNRCIINMSVDGGDVYGIGLKFGYIRDYTLDRVNECAININIKERIGNIRGICEYWEVLIKDTFVIRKSIININCKQCTSLGKGYFKPFVGVYKSEYDTYSLVNSYCIIDGPSSLLSNNDYRIDYNLHGQINNAYVIGPQNITDNYETTLNYSKDTFYFNGDRLYKESEGTSKRTDEQMKTQSTFEGWDFDTIWGIDPNINNGYPYLRWYTYKLLVALKVQGTDGIINIPIKEVNTSKQQLIFSLGTENRAVDLVNVNDANASNIRVMTEQGIKAISLY